MISNERLESLKILYKCEYNTLLYANYYHFQVYEVCQVKLLHRLSPTSVHAVITVQFAFSSTFQTVVLKNSQIFVKKLLCLS